MTTDDQTDLRDLANRIFGTPTAEPKTETENERQARLIQGNIAPREGQTIETGRSNRDPRDFANSLFGYHD